MASQGQCCCIQSSHDSALVRLEHDINCSHGAVGYKRKRCDKSMLIQVGWKWDFIEKNTPVLPSSSANMACRKGMQFFEDAEEFPVDSVYDVLDKVCNVPSRPLRVSIRVLISGFHKIK